ncbi:MAG: hypothetical protein HWN65_21980 [Candidatus Helarchaeota archaeon]|nr:hypothetical protein [Candidatus Helarchaeota archaeon]
MTLSQKAKLVKIYSICILCLTALVVGIFFWFYAIEKYACNLYHYNVQFVPGDTTAENNIINQSMRALLEMYENHPNWKFTIEISGYGLQIMYERFPDVLALFRKLNVETQQLELVSSPYSDQLSVAYPSTDILKAINFSLSKAKELNLTPSKVLFLQESQWLEDSYILEEYYDYFVVNKEAFSYYYPEVEANRVYSYIGLSGKEIKVITGDYIPNFDLTGALIFTYLGDGEATNTDSYGNHFQLKEDEQATYEATLKQLENLGCILSTVEEAAEKSESRKLEKHINDFGNLPDAFWNMRDCLGAYRWMGDNSHPKVMPVEFYGERTICAENDGELLAGNYRTRNFILMVETLYQNTSSSLNSTEKLWCQGNLTEAWKHLILGEVSDSTGWSPYWIEINYTLTHASIATNYANNALTIIKNKLGITNFNVSVYHNTVNASDFEVINKVSVTESDAIHLPQVYGANNYSIELKNCSWYGFDFQDVRVTVNISGIYQFEIRFEGLGKWMGYSSALLVDAVHYVNRDDFAEDVILPGANGFYYSQALGLGMIKNCSQRHTAGFFNGDALIFPEIGFNQVFISNWSTSVVTHQFFVYQGTADNASRLANMINSYPIGII